MRFVNALLNSKVADVFVRKNSVDGLIAVADNTYTFVRIDQRLQQLFQQYTIQKFQL